MKEQEHEAFGSCIEKHFPAPTPPTGTAPSAVRERERLLVIMGEFFQAGAAWQRTQSAGVPDVSAMARVLSDRSADACNIDRTDNWATYGQEYIEEVQAMLAAAPFQPAAQGVIDKPARIGATVFRPGVSVRTVIERAYRQYEYVESNLGEFIDWVWPLKEDRDAAIAQLAAIQGGMGEVVEVVGVLCVSRFRNNPAMENVEFHQAADIPQGQHDVMTVAQHQRITAAMAAEVERFAQANRELSEKNVRRREQVRQLRAELAELKGREAVPVAYVLTRDGEVCYEPDDDIVISNTPGDETDLYKWRPVFMEPPASPDVEGLVKALERFTSNSAAQANMPCECEEAEAALSTWRQAHTPSTLPASSAEE